MLAISHDRYFMNRIADRIWELRDRKLHSFIGDFDAYKEKSAQLLQQAEPSRTAAAVHPAASKAASAAKPATRRVEAVQRSGYTAAQQRVRLEQSIALAERNLAVLDEALQQLADSGESAALAVRFAERESVQAELDGLYAEWMALEESST
ncbi:hypothetical protein SAMN05443246_3454 [Paenibacillus sp. GP183]|nr:hypothetical protein SAMN05443246_3454 [Paenibacillus sp. GP183]